MAKATVKFNYFKELRSRLENEPEETFWSLSPVNDTVLGRIVSYVIFRRVGVDMPKYICDVMNPTNDVANDEAQTSVEDSAVLEFLSAWQTDPNITGLQAEAIAFRRLLCGREYQMWLAESLSRIPFSQWEKVRERFTKFCGNALYIVVFSTWMNVIRERSIQPFLERLPKELTLLEQYMLSRTIRGYSLGEKCSTMVSELRDQAKCFGETVVYLSHKRVTGLFNEVANTGKALDYGLTENGCEYYQHMSVLCGLWSVSQPKEFSEMSDDLVLSSAVNTLIGHGLYLFDVLRTYYVTEWKNKRGQQKAISNATDDEIVASLKKRIAALEETTQKAKKTINKLEKQLEQKETRAIKAEQNLELAEKRADAAEKELVVAQKSIAVSGERNHKVQSPPRVAANEQNGISETDFKTLSSQVLELSKALEDTQGRLDDMFAIISADGCEEIDTNTCSEIVEDIWKSNMEAFSGRLILYGGTNAWRERTKKWFESYGIKVRAYAPGDEISSVRQSDLFFLNIIENKHRYSIKCMNIARKAGAQVRICGVCNLEQTLRVIFEQPQYRAV